MHNVRLHRNMNTLRPPVKDYDQKATDLVFMQIDIDCDVVNETYNMAEEANGNTVLRMYGITQDSNSVCLIVEDFYPYFYVPKPPNFTHGDKENFASFLQDLLSEKHQTTHKYIHHIDIVEKTNIFMYTETIDYFLKITVFQPILVSTLRDRFENGIIYNDMEFSKTTYESKVNFPLRFMIDRGIVGMSWITVPKGKYIIRSVKVSNCQIEAQVRYNDIISHPPEGEFSQVAPIRILSLDIECAAKEGRFPNPSNDPVIQISNICVEFGSPDPIIQKIFTYKDCAPIPIVGVDVHSFEKEEDMLQDWRKFVIDLDPDIITGYNINMFDFPYLISRAEVLEIEDFTKLSRIKISQSQVKKKKSKVKGFMNRENIDVNLDGRVILDMFTYILHEYKLRSYSLNNVSFTFLGEQKEDLHHKMIYDLWNANEYTRRRLAIYCIKDAYLPLKLAEKLMTVYNYTEMCRVTCTPLNFILTRGQQIKVSSQLYRKAFEKNYIIPSFKIKNDGADESEDGYEGAFVLDPVKGFHQIPIVTLDFTSLYPSIMIAHNLCYSTLISAGDENSMCPDDYYRTPTGACFVREHIRKGILPLILEELLSARKKAKDDLKKATEPSLKAVFEGRQLALKISANSVYGFTGAQVGQLPCLEISSSVTAIGRTMIEKTREMVMNHFTIQNGYPHNAQVIYGDTDSVMIKFGVQSIKEAMILGKDASVFVSENFKKPIRIEFEKIYYPYLLMKKKKYAGVIWTREDTYDKIDTKGLEAVRRDNCELVRIMVETVLKKILLDRNVDDAVQYCKGMISDLLQNRIDLSLLVITKSLSKKTGNDTNEGKSTFQAKNKKGTYQGKQAHVELAEKMRKRDGGTAPNIGDRIAYVIVKGGNGKKNYENSEDPKYVLENNIPLDINYYLHNQIKKPLLRIFTPILHNPELTLFAGEHTRVIHSASAVCNSAFGKFLVSKKTCFHCKSVIKSGAVCKNCKQKLREIYLERLLEVNSNERLYADIWTQCQRCQGSLMQEAQCQNSDCPIFYKRIKIQKELKDNQSNLMRFNEPNDW